MSIAHLSLSGVEPAARMYVPAHTSAQRTGNQERYLITGHRKVEREYAQGCRPEKHELTNK